MPWLHILPQHHGFLAIASGMNHYLLGNVASSLGGAVLLASTIRPVVDRLIRPELRDKVLPHVQACGAVLVVAGLFMMQTVRLQPQENTLTVVGVLVAYVISKEVKRKRGGAVHERYLSIAKKMIPALIIISMCQLLFDQVGQVRTGSMLPNFYPSDMLRVRKSAYDVKLPFTSYVIWKRSDPHRGDVVIVAPPTDNIVASAIKRIIAVPGDILMARGDDIYLNGKILPRKFKYRLVETISGEKYSGTVFEETNGQKSYDILMTDGVSGLLAYVPELDNNEHCKVTAGSYTCQIPADMFFVMGDNRHHSEDSRSYGLLKRKQIQGLVIANTSKNTVS